MRLCLNMLIFTHNLGNWLIIVLLQQPRACCRQSHQEHWQISRSGKAWN